MAVVSFNEDFPNIQVSGHPILRFTLRDLEKEENREYTKEEVLKAITGKQVYEALREDPLGFPQCEIRAKQVRAIAHSFGRMMAACYPINRIICIGRQAENDPDLTIEPAKEFFHSNPEAYHLPSLKQPEIIVNDIESIGARGAVAYFLTYYQAS